MAANKLDPQQQGALETWLCEGLDNATVLERVQTEFGITLVRQTIDHYRDQYADTIAAAEEACYQRIIQQGMTRRSERIKALAAEAERAREALQAFRPGQRGWAQANAEWRAILKDIRDEMNQLRQRVEITGKDGGPMQTEDATARNLLAGLLAGIATRAGAEDPPSDTD